MSEPYGAIRRLFEEGDLFEAYDRVRRLLSDSPDDVTLLELRMRAEEGLGLDARLSLTLDRLEQLAPESEELHGFRGKLNKRRALRTTGEARRAFLEKALPAYQRGYELTGGYWTGINVATIQHLLGRQQEAAATAREVQAAVEPLLAVQDPDSTDALWSLGTLGEALLIQGDVAAAVERYAALRDAAAKSRAWTVLASVRRNAREILSASDTPSARESVEHALRRPRLAAFVGHMFDQPGREPARFPDSSEIAVAETLRRLIDAEDVQFGISSLASGGDTLFQEALQEAQLRRRIVLPFPADAFREVSVTSDQASRFDALLDEDHLSQAMPHRIDAQGLEFDITNRFLDGLAQIRAEQLGADLLRVAIWDGKPGDGRGGTADTVRMWRSCPGARLILVDPMDGRCRAEEVAPDAVPDLPKSDQGRYGICALLFGDAQGFSRLDEKQIYAFNEVFLGAIAEHTGSARYRDHIRVKNTWGDALFLALDDVPIAGELALDLRDALHAAAARARFRKAGLPDELQMRIALHAALVRLGTDPITNAPIVSGTQVSHAARMEPITPVGEVYASDTFAALSRAEGATTFRCDYVGETLLAKNFGTFPTYHVRRS